MLLRILAALILVVSVLCSSARAADYTFEIVVANGDVIDGVQVNTDVLVGPLVRLNNSGQIVFYMDQFSTFKWKIFTLDHLIAENGTIIGGETINQSRNLTPPDLNDSGVVSFFAETTSGDGIFTQDSVVAKQGTVLGGITLDHFGSWTSINSSGEIAFVGHSQSDPNGSGLYAQNGPLVRTGDVVDGKELDFITTTGFSLNDSGEIAFISHFKGSGTAIFAAGRAVVQVGDVIDGKTLSGFDTPLFLGNGGDVVFRARTDSGQGIFHVDSTGQVSTLVHTREGPWQSIESLVGFDANNAGEVVFWAYHDNLRQGVFALDGPVITVGGQVAGRAVRGVGLPTINDRGDIAVPVVFSYDFTHGIVLARKTQGGNDPTITLSLPGVECDDEFVWVSGKELAFSVIGIDPDPNDTVTVEFDGTLPDGATFTPVGLFSWTPDASQEGPNTLAFLATTSTGREASCSIIVDVSVDRDGDGLLDLWETDGFTAPNGVFVDLPAMGANPDHKDLFVYIDWMANAEYDHRPQDEAMQWVVDAFADSPVANPDGIDGISLHLMISPTPTDVFVENLGTGYYNWARPEGYAGAELFFDDFKKGIFDGDGVELLRPHFPEELTSTHRHCMFVHQIAGRTASGASRGFPSSDLIVSLGAFVVESGPMPYRPSKSAQAGTFMHEFGHCLGLRHGGGDNTLYKPNYLSVMNYSFQLSGLTAGGAAGKFDYSREALPALSEAALSEESGLAGWPAAALGFQTLWRILKTDAAGIPEFDPLGNFVYETLWTGPVGTPVYPVNWNNKGGIEPGLFGLSINRNFFPNEVLTGFNDWANLDFKGGTVGAGIPLELPAATVVEELEVEVAREILPPPPQGLAGRAARGMVRLSWIPAGPRGDVSYCVYRALQGDDLEKVATTGSTLFADRGLVVGETYDYAVGVVDALGTESEVSDRSSILIR